MNQITRIMLKKVFFVLLVVSFAACGSTPRVNLDSKIDAIKPNPEHSAIAKEIVNIFERYTYKKVNMNDSISGIIYDNLLKTLDEGKNYFQQEDINAFQAYRLKIGDDLKKGDLSAPYHIFNVYIERYLQRMEHALTQIEVEHDFSIPETYVYNRKDLDYFQDENEANDQWRKRVKYDLLNLRLGTKELTDSVVNSHKELLRNRYNELISQTKKSDNNEAFQIIIAAMTEAIDPHTSYFNPYFAQQYNEGISNTFEGIGARLVMENEVVKVMEVIVGGPVFREKALEIDDKIIAVAQGEDGEFEDIVGWRLDRAVSKIKGPKGTIVRLKVIPAGQEMTANPKIVSLTREKIVVEEESAKKEIKIVKGEDGKDYKVGIISIPKFYLDFNALRNRDPNYKSTTRDVKLILDTLKQENVDAVLVDLRFNGGGSLLESVELTGLFIPYGPVVQVRDTRDRVEVNSDTDPSVYWDGPMAVLVNRMSASASEIFAGAIQDYGRGLVIGSTTYGKGTVQSAIDMGNIISASTKLLLKAQSNGAQDEFPVGAPQFGQINMTMAKYYRVTGHSTQHKGVIPDILFPSNINEEKYGESAYPAALPWDQIASSKFEKTGDFSQIIPKIDRLHQERIQKEPGYKFLLEDIKLISDREKENSITLQAEALKAERDKDSKKNRERINTLLANKGLPLWKEGEEQPKLEVDFIKEQTLMVMTDFIRFLKEESAKEASN